MYLEDYSNRHDISFFKDLIITAINLFKKWKSQSLLSIRHKVPNIKVNTLLTWHWVDKVFGVIDITTNN